MKKKKDVPALTVLHITIHRCPEALSDFAQAYPEPHTTAVCQPSRNTKQTQNHGHTTGDSKQSMKEKKTQKRKKKVCERVRQEMTDSVWQNKYMSHLATVSHFPSLMLCQFCYSVPEGTFWIGSFNKCSSYLKLQVR